MINDEQSNEIADMLKEKLPSNVVFTILLAHENDYPEQGIVSISNMDHEASKIMAKMFIERNLMEIETIPSKK